MIFIIHVTHINFVIVKYDVNYFDISFFNRICYTYYDLNYFNNKNSSLHYDVDLFHIIPK